MRETGGTEPLRPHGCPLQRVTETCVGAPAPLLPACHAEGPKAHSLAKGNPTEGAQFWPGALFFSHQLTTLGARAFGWSSSLSASPTAAGWQPRAAGLSSTQSLQCRTQEFRDAGEECKFLGLNGAAYFLAPISSPSAPSDKITSQVLFPIRRKSFRCFS